MLQHTHVLCEVMCARDRNIVPLTFHVLTLMQLFLERWLCTQLWMFSWLKFNSQSCLTSPCIWQTLFASRQIMSRARCCHACQQDFDAVDKVLSVLSKTYTLLFVIIVFKRQCCFVSTYRLLQDAPEGSGILPAKMIDFVSLRSQLRDISALAERQPWLQKQTESQACVWDFVVSLVCFHTIRQVQKPSRKTVGSPRCR